MMTVRDVLGIIARKNGAYVYAYYRMKDAAEGNFNFDYLCDTEDEHHIDRLNCLLDHNVVRIDSDKVGGCINIRVMA